VAVQPEIDARTPELQVAQCHFLEERGQYWVPQPNFILGLIELQAERGPKRSHGTTAWLERFNTAKPQ
jgi:hypothetical protein